MAPASSVPRFPNLRLFEFFIWSTLELLTPNSSAGCCSSCSGNDVCPCVITLSNSWSQWLLGNDLEEPCDHSDLEEMNVLMRDQMRQSCKCHIVLASFVCLHHWFRWWRPHNSCCWMRNNPPIHLVAVPVWTQTDAPSSLALLTPRDLFTINPCPS